MKGIWPNGSVSVTAETRRNSLEQIYGLRRLNPVAAYGGNPIQKGEKICNPASQKILPRNMTMERSAVLEKKEVLHEQE
jgi:hypothetical protein